MREIRGWQPRAVPGNPKVSLAIATYEQRAELACLLFSLVAQTYENWEAVVVHDGPGPTAREVVALVNDSRVRLIETPERRGHYGHPWRELGIDACTGDYLGLSNGDNYYVPVYFEWMLHELATRGAEFAYCDWVHSHFEWRAMQAEPVRWKIDLGGWIVRAGLAKTTPWPGLAFDSDGDYVEALVKKASGVVHIPRSLFVHN